MESSIILPNLSGSMYSNFLLNRNNAIMAVSFMLAPMAELSHRALRELIEGFSPCPGGSADEYYTEMISAAAFVNGGEFEKWYADNGPCPGKLVYQIVGGDEEQLCRAAALLDKKECLGIDVNMGCSAPAITRTGAGVRWMASIERSGALIRRLRRQVTHRLSVKLRTGLEDDFEYLVNFCRRLEEEGVELIALHPRTAREKFRRRARWDYVGALRNELGIPVAGNGDISSAEEMLRRSEECDAVMIGRLAVRCPWVFSEAKKVTVTISAVIIKETGLRFLELLSRYQPPEFHVSRARRFFHYFCDNLKWGNYVKNLINRETGLLGIEQVWCDYFSKLS